MEKEYAEATELLYKGRKVKGMDFNKPEAFPLFTTTAFTMNSLTEVKKAYAEKYTYIRTCNPNRDALADMVTFLEAGEKSLIFSSGMGAITTTLKTILKPGDHVVCNRNIYGETFDVFTKLMPKFGINADLVDFDDIENCKKAIKAETKLIYSEVFANPTLNIADIPTLADIAHKNGALLMIDNTFSTPIAIKPIKFGADIVINSLTKFMNGHSDAIAGSITSTTEIIDAIHPVRMLCGTPGDPHAAHAMMKSFATMDLRLKKQMSNAAKLATALEENKYVSKVNHPSLKSFSQIYQIKNEDFQKIDKFMLRLNFAHYAMTLGGVRTTLVHPVTSSHSHMPDEARRAMGITPGLFRLSVGIEDVDDLIEDFNQALKVFGE